VPRVTWCYNDIRFSVDSVQVHADDLWVVKKWVKARKFVILSGRKSLWLNSSSSTFLNPNSHLSLSLSLQNVPFIVQESKGLYNSVQLYSSNVPTFRLQTSFRKQIKFNQTRNKKLLKYLLPHRPYIWCTCDSPLITWGQKQNTHQRHTHTFSIQTGADR